MPGMIKALCELSRLSSPFYRWEKGRLARARTRRSHSAISFNALINSQLFIEFQLCQTIFEAAGIQPWTEYGQIFALIRQMIKIIRHATDWIACLPLPAKFIRWSLNNRNQSLPDLEMEFPAFRTVGNKFLWLKPPSPGHSVTQPKLTGTCQGDTFYGDCCFLFQC